MKSMLIISALLFSLTACTPTVANRGNVVEDESLAQIHIGVSDQAAVQTILGPPTTVGTFDKNIWYYAGMRTKKQAFFDPKVSYARALIVTFDPAGIVSAIENVDPQLAENIDPVTRTTKTGGRDMTFLQQLMNNVTRPTLPGSILDKRNPGDARRN